MIRMHALTTAALAVLVSAGSAIAQESPEPVPPVPVGFNRERPPVVPLRLQVVLSRHQGEKRTSNVPYMLSVSTGQKASQLRMGARVPIPMTGFGTEGGPPAVSSFNYEQVGTSIDCSALALDDGRYQINIGIDDSAPYETDKVEGTNRPPSFRSFRSNQTIVLKDGQSTQFTMATDKLTGEVVRVEVSLTVVK
jgi:hypothetical protein